MEYEEYSKVLIPIFKELKHQTFKWKDYGVNEVFLEGTRYKKTMTYKKGGDSYLHDIINPESFKS